MTRGAIRLRVEGGPPGAHGVFFFGVAPDSTPFGDGQLCIDRPVIRLRPNVKLDAAGTAFFDVGLNGPPLGAGPHAVSGGAVRYFQFYFRDAHGPGGSGYNLSDGLKVTFCE